MPKTFRGGDPLFMGGMLRLHQNYGEYNVILRNLGEGVFLNLIHIRGVQGNKFYSLVWSNVRNIDKKEGV